MARPNPNPRSRSLKQIVDHNGPLPVSRAANFVEQAARLLEVYHERGRLHADVRPGNVFVNERDEVSLGPSPCAEENGDRFPHEDDLVKLSDAVDCLAPEAAVTNKLVDGRADQYSLGCAFYFILAGRSPFSEGSISERLLQHQASRPRAVSEIRGDVPQEISAICATMLEKKPADRFATSMVVAEVIRAWRMQDYD